MHNIVCTSVKMQLTCSTVYVHVSSFKLVMKTKQNCTLYYKFTSVIFTIYENVAMTCIAFCAINSRGRIIHRGQGIVYRGVTKEAEVKLRR
jgi:hypothetical protein